MIFFGLSVRDGMIQPRGFGGRSLCVSFSHAPRRARHQCVYGTGATGRRNKTLGPRGFDLPFQIFRLLGRRSTE
jgi:hypothetical protein